VAELGVGVLTVDWVWEMESGIGLEWELSAGVLDRSLKGWGLDLRVG
jgi:hypothetical protein